MAIKRFLRKVWNDPVGANVIASLFCTLIVFLAAIFIPAVNKLALLVLNIIGADPFLYSTIILFIIVGVLLVRHKYLPSKSKKVSISFLRHLSKDELSQYPFLFWFPINHTLKTSQYYHASENIDHIPEIRELIDRKVLSYIFDGVMYYSIEIDKECYKYLDSIYRSLPKAEKESQSFRAFHGKEFIKIV